MTLVSIPLRAVGTQKDILQLLGNLPAHLKEEKVHVPTGNDPLHVPTGNDPLHVPTTYQSICEHYVDIRAMLNTHPSLSRCSMTQSTVTLSYIL